MEFERYKELVDTLEDNFKKDKENLAIKYALSNNTVNVGTIVSDNRGSIIVESIKTDTGFGQYKPCCIYYGSILGEGLTPLKNGGKRSVNQRNIC